METVSTQENRAGMGPRRQWGLPVLRMHTASDVLTTRLTRNSNSYYLTHPAGDTLHHPTCLLPFLPGKVNEGTSCSYPHCLGKVNEHATKICVVSSLLHLSLSLAASLYLRNTHASSCVITSCQSHHNYLIRLMSSTHLKLGWFHHSYCV